MHFRDHPNYHNADIRAALNALTDAVTESLGDMVAGVWLQGSSATGDFDEHSDLDFVVGVVDELSDTDVARLQEVHRGLYAHPSMWSKHLEGSYFPIPTMKDYRRSGTDLWYLDHGSTTLERSAHDNTIVVKWILREKGVVLMGPEPSTLIDPIPVDDLRSDIYRTFANWAHVIEGNPSVIGSHFYQSFAVLSYCRMLNDIRQGTIGSKRAGADWAAETLAPEWRDLIDRAWGGRPDPAASVQRPAAPEDVDRTVRLVGLVIEQARRLMISFGLSADT